MPVVSVTSGRKPTGGPRRGGTRSPALAVALAVVALLVPGFASANHGPVPPRPLPDMTVTPANGRDLPVTWTGTLTSGANAQYDFDTGEPCSPNPSVDYCDIALVHVDLSSQPGYWDAHGGGVEIHLGDYSPNPASDFDLQVFESDEDGTKGRLIGTSGAIPGEEERTTIVGASGYYLIQVVYFAVTQSQYTGTIRFVPRHDTPDDIDEPAGLQEVLASNPSLGFRSHSEPHLAQSPTDDDLLVAASKMYNRDPDSLPEYEFKIGSYVSFDAGRSWSDLGQTAVCPPEQAPPESWPDNTCYPDEDPARDGTGAEDKVLLPGLTVDASPAGAEVGAGEEIQGVEFTASRPLEDGAVGSFPVFYADDGFGCDWTSAVLSGVTEWIALAKRGGEHCPTFQAKLTAATGAGADGIIIVNNGDTLPTGIIAGATGVPAIIVKLSDGNRLISSVQAGAVRATLDIVDFATPRGGGGDFGEEYITSDAWVQLDDEGNAYLMVLDNPAGESGWGMSLHRWETVSPADVSGGQTWGPKIAINEYHGVEADLFLDDKNTFAVNNAGPDGDGQTGIMIACWGQNVPGVLKQQIVCERSVDAGQSWTGNGVVDEPQPISGAEQLVIGVHVVADQHDPQRFYATWLSYAQGIAGLDLTMNFTQTLDGGVTWLPPVPIATLNGIPRQFPEQSFRNLSIPIMAAGPAGELYVVYADYRAANEAWGPDLDGEQADIMLVKSELMGLPSTWSEPIRVNQDETNGDQFQPYVAVNPDGQVEVVYFDRRLDDAVFAGEQMTHPGNFFIDTYLSRSSDGGQTWTDVRLSHDSWDPTVNPPVSSSGDFIGDYEGLVVDECFAYPFVNDTHLANDPSRDPDFDSGMPRSEYQEVFVWRVPNTEAFGGSGAGLVDCAREPGGVRAQGAGKVPGRNGSGSASFGLQVRSTSTEVTKGHISFKEKGGPVISSRSVGDVFRASGLVVIRGTCSVDGGAGQPCEVRIKDVADPGAGHDEFRITVGDYAAGGVLTRGNITIE